MNPANLKISDVDAMARKYIADMEREERSIESKIPTLEELEMSMSLLQSQKQSIEEEIRATDGALRQKAVEKWEANKKAIEELKEKRKKVLEFHQIKRQMQENRNVVPPPITPTNPFKSLQEGNEFSVPYQENPPMYNPTYPPPTTTPPPPHAVPAPNDFILNAIYAEIKETKSKLESLMLQIQELRLDLARNTSTRKKAKSDVSD